MQAVNASSHLLCFMDQNICKRFGFQLLFNWLDVRFMLRPACWRGLGFPYGLPRNPALPGPSQQGDALTPEQYSAIEELGILADKDDQGVLLQIFTKPLGDRCVPGWMRACNPCAEHWGGSMLKALSV